MIFDRSLSFRPHVELDRWMSPSTLGIQSRLPSSLPTDIQTPPTLPQRVILRQRLHSIPHSVLFQYQFYVFYLFLQYFFQIFKVVLFVLFCSWPQKLVFVRSGEEILTHYFFKPQYLSIRVFDIDLLLISEDIEENAGPVSFERYQKTFTNLYPFPLTSSEF